ncbi:hypothetical protein J2W42_002642 [Rhizobium tibeticum]|uniref:hypothetical protein n=1 Tax=Rhizobium tibeticum TaxID=501024 RepID=UPI002788F3AC|nr:hypothetical protein [Rhizobium tibeticum]MDP9809783.1 hypothetical protein [Rhizobium tibeticum]
MVQQIYRDWIVSLFLPLEWLANLGNAIAVRDDRTAMVLSIAAAVLLALNVIILWPFTQPANAGHAALDRSA